jgi:hypothetical protein
VRDGGRSGGSTGDGPAALVPEQVDEHLAGRELDADNDALPAASGEAPRRRIRGGRVERAAVAEHGGDAGGVAQAFVRSFEPRPSQRGVVEAARANRRGVLGVRRRGDDGCGEIADELGPVLPAERSGGDQQREPQKSAHSRPSLQN